MPKKLSEETIKEIRSSYEELKSYSKVADKLGLSVSTVSKYVRLGDTTPERKERTLITDELEEKINLRYSECKNLSLVAREFNISVSTVRNHLTEENLHLKDMEYMDRDALFFYIIRLFGMQSEDKPVSDWNLTQMNKFKAQGMPYRGQLLTLKYFYEVEGHTTEKAHGSIGIVPFAWQRAASYYERQATKADQITEQIKRQLEKDRLEIPIDPKNFFGRRKSKKKTIDLDSLGE